MRTILLLLAMSCVTPLSAEVELLNPILGKHAMLTWQMESGRAGALEIYATPDRLGWRTVPAQGMEKSVPAVDVGIVTASALVYKANSYIVIEDSASSRRASIQYALKEGVLLVDTMICLESGVCESYMAEAKLSQTAGETLDVHRFFESRSGSYKILKAGGEVITKEETFDVDAVNDPNEAAIYAPYCEPGTNLCDLGYLSLPWNETKVVKVAGAEGELVYEISTGEGAAQKLYRWVELSDGRVLFRNFQYLLPSTQKNVVLDHEVERLPN